MATAAAEAPTSVGRRFSDGFYWGVATSAYQIEGALDEDGKRVSIKQMQTIWGAKSIFITENGCGASDPVADDGRVYDSDRLMFLRACLGQLQRLYVDFETLERTPKLSAEWFREAARQNAVV
jgi:beta-glucosidase/6-phospho-beta-glucosidase/beta-galactosidase